MSVLLPRSPAAARETRQGSPPALGIFVGGRGSRMGGVAKANLTYQGRTILERTLDSCRAAWSRRFGAAEAPRIWLVGESAAYRASGVLRVADDPMGRGPLGGLRAFLRALAPDTAGVAIAGDLPFLTEELILRLATEVPGAAALAPRAEDGRWQPLFARYLPEKVLPGVDVALASGDSSLQQVLRRLGEHASVLQLSAAEQLCLRDWDRPSDVTAGCPEATS